MDSEQGNKEIEEKIIIRKPPCNCSILHKLYNTVNTAYKLGQLKFQQNDGTSSFYTCTKNKE
ncbi:unnamed protein product [Paramecium sonneborni]|uniref:Uncharacterized protein n=1 Tax=Paramecium sonneborni TaxID=65129 RepID=A0A8S1LKC8_9CILI|nr:unnamed protein product [Paramecium sonneborni]